MVMAEIKATPVADATVGPPAHWPADKVEMLSRVATLLERGGPEAALAYLDRKQDGSPWAVNARAVCLLRLGLPQAARDALRPGVIGAGGFGLRDEAPTELK